MTIEYKDSKRIVGLSSDVVDTATYETETFTPNWDQNTTGTTNIAVANSRVEYNVTGSGTQQSTLVYDLGTANISEDKWILRGKSVITNYTVGGDGSSCHLFCGLSNGNKTVAFDGSQNSISFTIGAGTNDDNYYIGSGVNGAMYSMTSHTFAGVMAHEPTEETVYFELIRNNSTSVTLTLYTDSTYTTSPSGYTQTATLSSAPTGLRYLVFKARDRSVSGSDCEGNIDDLKFYNGVSSLSSKPTDVQDNSILVEKDTAKRFWYSPVSADTAWSQTTSNDGVNVQYGTSAETSKLGQKFETNHANVGKTFTQVTVRLKRYTAASGNASAGHIIYCKVYNSSGTARATASTTYVYSTLATSYADKTFTFATPITIGANEIVGFESNGGAYDVETFNFRVNSSSTESDTTMIDYRNGAWGTTFAAWEMMMTLGTPATATWTQMPPILGLGMFMGGNINPPVSANIDYITIATTGNSTTFGELITARYSADSVNSETRAIIGSGSSGSGNVIGFEYITTASPSNATVFGDDTISRNYSGGVSNGTRGCWGGGYENDNTNGVTISKVTIATTGNATDFGDLSDARRYISSVHSDTRGIWGGGTSIYPTQTVQYVTIATAGTATSAGNFLTKNTSSGCGFENDTRGVFAGGDSYPNGHIQSMDYLTMASLAEAADFGDLSSTTNYPSACSSDTRGVIGGGIEGTTLVNKIQYVTIATTGDAEDFGDLSSTRYSICGAQGS